jgi:hypothetical protein
MFITYTIPRDDVSDILRSLKDISELEVILYEEVDSGEQGTITTFDIDYESHKYQFVVMEPSPSESEDPNRLKCWLLVDSHFNLLNPISWIHWVARDRKKYDELTKLLTERIGMEYDRSL